MPLPIGMNTHTPIVIEAATYDETGLVVSFDDLTTDQKEKIVGVSILVYTGTALVNLEGDPNGKKIKIPSGIPFDFGVGTDKIFIKGLGGSCEACIVGAMFEG